MEAPLPSIELMRRAGHPANVPDERIAADYLRLGSLLHSLVLDRLPDDWSVSGRRILDFGAGAGRVTRHFGPELDRGAEIWACDIYQPAVAWAHENLPQISFFQSAETPPLEVPDGHFDLVYAMSVFTHLTNWAEWLSELHRVLRPGGLLIASFLGRTVYEAFSQEPYDESRVGMLVMNPEASWEAGGPTVFHSQQWLKAHWSPAFDLMRIEEPADVDGESIGHGIVVGRRKAVLASFPQG